jgi:hypothetical protein
MWDHRNGIKYKTVTLARRQEIDGLDARIRAEFQIGTAHILP